jgi:hypothetical protein
MPLCSKEQIRRTKYCLRSRTCKFCHFYVLECPYVQRKNWEEENADYEVEHANSVIYKFFNAPMFQRTNEKKTNAGYEVEHTYSVIYKLLHVPMFRRKNWEAKNTSC